VKGFSEMSRADVDRHMTARARDLEPPDDEGREYEIESDNPAVRNQAWTDYMTARVNGASEDDFETVEADKPDEAA
jgi:hypothetical protein